MKRKMTWLAGALGALLILTPALIAQTTWVVSGDDDDDGDRPAAYTLFGYDDSAFLGVTMEEETEHEGGGALITSVVEDSPADEAGLEEGDIVIRFGKDTIRGPVALTKKIRDLEPGDEIEVTVLRDGRKISIDVELGKRSSYSTSWSNVAPRVLGQLQELELPEFDMEALEDQLEGLGQLGELGKLNNYRFFGNEEWQEKLSELGSGFTYRCEDGDCDYSDLSGLYFSPGRARLGVQLTETTPELREHLGGSEDAGVLVSKVVKNSAAEKAGVEVGDLIVAVDGDEIGGTNDLRRALAKREGEIFDIEVIRGGRSISLSVTLEEDGEDRPTGPRAYYRRLPTTVAPAITAPRIAPRVVPRITPQIRERIRLAPGVVEVDGSAPTLAAVPVAPTAPPAPVAVPSAPEVAIAPVAIPAPAAAEVAIAPLAISVPSAPAALAAPAPAALPAPEADVLPALAPVPEMPPVPHPVRVVPSEDDVI